MTREEAIKLLLDYSQYSYGIWHNDEEDSKAFDMAIEALSEPSIVRCGDCKWHADGDENIASYCQNGDGLIGEVTDGMWCCYGERSES